MINRILTAALVTILANSAMAATTYPSPTYQDVSVLGNLNGHAPGAVALSGDCTASGTFTAAVTCLKTNGVAFTAAATTALGTSGAAIPLMSTANTWAPKQTFSSGILSPNIQITATGGTGSLINYSGNAPGPTNTLIYELGNVFGSTNFGGALHYFADADTLSDTVPIGNFDTWEFIETPGGGTFAGSRDVIHALCNISSAQAGGTPGTQGQACVGALTHVEVAAAKYGNGYGNTDTNGAFPASAFGGNDRCHVAGGVINFGNIICREIDLVLDTGATMANNIGLLVQVQGTGGSHGIFANSGYVVGADVGVTTGLLDEGFTVSTRSFPINALGSAFSIRPSHIPTTNTLLFGLDLRAGSVASGGAAIAAKNFFVGSTGVVHATSLQTTSTISAQQATMTGYVIDVPGTYTSPPTLTVDAPASGVTATIAPATYSLTGIASFGSTGNGYSVNDILTPVVVLGTAPTLKVTAVNADGGITACTINGAGSVTKRSANPNYTTGGTGTHAGLIIDYSGTSATACRPGVTGRNYIVGDTIGTGGTGTPGALTVDTVDSFGGILTAHESSLGSITAFPTEPFSTTGGTGTSASLTIGFGIATATITNAGSGYTKEPPLIYSPDDINPATIRAVMTAAEAPISFQTGGQLANFGGAVTVGSTKFTASGCSNSTTVGSGTAGKFTSGTAGTCTVVLTLNGATGITAPNGWACYASDRTTPTNLISQTADSVTTATISGPTSSGDVISFGCQAY